MAGPEIDQSGAHAVSAQRAERRDCGNAHRRRGRRVCATGIALLLLSACGNSGKVDDAIARNTSQDLLIQSLERQVQNLSEQVNRNEAYYTTELTPDDKGYGMLVGSGISATASLEGLKQNGSAVDARVTFGNLMSATLKGCKTMVSVRKSKNGSFETVGYRKIDRDLLPGTYVETTLTIPDLKIGDVSAISLMALNCERMSMST